MVCKSAPLMSGFILLRFVDLDCYKSNKANHIGLVPENAKIRVRLARQTNNNIAIQQCIGQA